MLTQMVQQGQQPVRHPDRPGLRSQLGQRAVKVQKKRCVAGVQFGQKLHSTQTLASVAAGACSPAALFSPHTRAKGLP